MSAWESIPKNIWWDFILIFFKSNSCFCFRDFKALCAKPVETVTFLCDNLRFTWGQPESDSSFVRAVVVSSLFWWFFRRALATGAASKPLVCPSRRLRLEEHQEPAELSPLRERDAGTERDVGGRFSFYKKCLNTFFSSLPRHHSFATWGSEPLVS